MEREITFVDSAPRSIGNQLWAMTDYSFRVSDGETDQYVHVGVTDQMRSLEAPSLSREDVIVATKTWLERCTDKGLKEFTEIREGRMLCDMPHGILGYWAEHHEVPSWLF
jgi:hypothetical protein